MPKNSRPRRWDSLLEDPDLNRWYKNARRSSPSTARTYLGGLGRSLDAIGQSPQSILKLDQKGRDDAVTDVISHFESPPDDSPPLAPGTVHVYQAAVVSWLHWNGLPPKRKFKVTNRGWNPQAETFNILTQEQVRRFYHVAGPRARVVGAFINFSGVRPEVLGWEDGSKGLRLKHLPKLHITGDGFVVRAAARIRCQDHVDHGGGSSPAGPTRRPHRCDSSSSPRTPAKWPVRCSGS